MDAKTPAIGSTHFERSDGQITSTEVLIIGLGLSAIPLIRELEKDGIEYVIVSQGQSIWERLEQHGRLDFDLVSSLHTSLYSFELVKARSRRSLSDLQGILGVHQIVCKQVQVQGR